MNYWYILSLCFFALPSSNQFVVAEVSDLDKSLFDASAAEDIDAAATALKEGANINALSPRGLQTPLMQSVLHGRAKMVKFFLENGADVNIGERDGYTPMHGAGFQGRKEIAELLLKHGVGLRDKHADGYEPAIRSCWGPESRHTETVEWFLDNGVPLDDIYDDCIERGSDRTKQLLESRKSRTSGEL